MGRGRARPARPRSRCSSRCRPGASWRWPTAMRALLRMFDHELADGDRPGRARGRAGRARPATSVLRSMRLQHARDRPAVPGRRARARGTWSAASRSRGRPGWRGASPASTGTSGSASCDAAPVRRGRALPGRGNRLRDRARPGHRARRTCWAGRRSRTSTAAAGRRGRATAERGRARAPASPTTTGSRPLVALGRLRARRGDPSRRPRSTRRSRWRRGPASSSSRAGARRRAPRRPGWPATATRALAEAARGLRPGASRSGTPGWPASWRSGCGGPARGGAAADWLAEPFAPPARRRLARGGATPGAARLPVRARRARWPTATRRPAATALGDLRAASAPDRPRPRCGARCAAAACAACPRGPRPATRANPLGLTARERRDPRPARRGPAATPRSPGGSFIAPKTVDHHVSAVLAKLDSLSRQAAARLAGASR